MKIGTIIKQGIHTYEKRPHGWVDAGCNEVVIDETLIGSKYKIVL